MPEAEQAAGEVSLHKVGETADGIVVRGARMLATLAPFADELAVYPGSDLRPQDAKYAVCFAIPMGTPGLRFLCRDSFSLQRDPWDYPLSSRFDEMDAVAIFDDVVVPWDRVFLDGDAALHCEVITGSHWRAHIIHQAMTRAWAKLEFAFGLAHTLADMTGVNTFDHVQEKLGELWSMMEMTRAGVIAAEAGSHRAEGSDDWVPDERPFVALRGLMPKMDPARDRADPARRRRWLHGDAVEGRLGGAAARRHRDVLPGPQCRRRAPDPRVPARLGLRRLRDRQAAASSTSASTSRTRSG